MTTIIMISNNSSVIINNSRDDNCSETTNVKRSQASPTSSTGSSISSRNSFSPTLDQRKQSKNNDNNNKNHKIMGMTKKIINKNSCTKNSLSTLESEDSEFNQSSAASTLSSTGGNSSSTSGIANSITYFPSLDEEFEAESFVETSTPVANKQPLHSLRFFVDPTNSKKSMAKSAGNQCKNSNYDTRSLDRRRILLRENLLTIKSPEDPKAYCTLRRRSLHQEHEKLTTGSSKPSSNNCISNVSLEFPSSSSSQREFDETHRVRKVVKSVISKETTIAEPNIVDESSVVKNNNNELVNNHNNNNCDTSDDDDLSHAEELSYDSSQVTSSEVESLTGSNSNLNSGIVLPTGWHRHPGHHHCHAHQVMQNSNNLGPLDEIVHAEEIEDENCNEIDSEISDHIYSTVVKSKESPSESSEGGSSSKNSSRHGPRFHSVLRSSRILRRHTTYYHAKQFDSLPPQASTSSLLVSTSSTKPHVHSWHRHKQSRGERGISTQYQVSIPIF